MQTLSIIKADTGGFVGQPAVHPQMVAPARERPWGCVQVAAVGVVGGLHARGGRIFSGFEEPHLRLLGSTVNATGDHGTTRQVDDQTDPRPYVPSGPT